MLMNYRRQSVFETTKIIRQGQATSRNNTRCKAINKTRMNSKTVKVTSRINSKAYIQSKQQVSKVSKINEKLVIVIHDFNKFTCSCVIIFVICFAVATKCDARFLVAIIVACNVSS